MHGMKHLLALLLIILPLSATAADDAIPSAGTVQITPLLRTQPSLPATPADTAQALLETVIVQALFPPGSGTGIHSHPGDEYATVIEGMVELRRAGEPPRQIHAGQAYHNTRGAIHETLNPSANPARVVSTFIIPKGQTLVQPEKSPP